MAQTRAQANRAIRQEALREQLAGKGLVQKVLATVEEIAELDPSDESFSNTLAKHKAASELRLKLIAKYLPDLKSTELTSDPDRPLVTKIVQEIIDGASDKGSA